LEVSSFNFFANFPGLQYFLELIVGIEYRVIRPQNQGFCVFNEMGHGPWLFSQSKNLTPPTNYRTEFGYVLRCGELLTGITPHIGPNFCPLTTRQP
jgi:hypothetical protein